MRESSAAAVLDAHGGGDAAALATFNAPLVTTKLLPTGIRWKTWLNLSGWLSPSVCFVCVCVLLFWGREGEASC